MAKLKDELLQDLRKADKERNQKLDAYLRYYYKIYNECNHIVIRSADDYDPCEGRHNFEYGCIKCGLNTDVKHDLPYDVMRRYNEKTHYYIASYNLCNLDFVIKYEEDLETGFNRARIFYQEIIAENPNVTDVELIRLLEEKIDKARNEVKGQPRVRMRRQTKDEITPIKREDLFW